MRISRSRPAHSLVNEPAAALCVVMAKQIAARARTRCSGRFPDMIDVPLRILKFVVISLSMPISWHQWRAPSAAGPRPAARDAVWGGQPASTPADLLAPILGRVARPELVPCVAVGVAGHCGSVDVLFGRRQRTRGSSDDDRESNRGPGEHGR